MQTINVGNGQWMSVYPPGNRIKGLIIPVVINDDKDMYRAAELLGRIYRQEDQHNNNTYLTTIYAIWGDEGPIIQTVNGKRWICMQRDNAEKATRRWTRLVDGNNVDGLRLHVNDVGMLALTNIYVARANGNGIVDLFDNDCIYVLFKEQDKTASAHREYLHQIAMDPRNAGEKAAQVMKRRAQMTRGELERDSDALYEAVMAIQARAMKSRLY